MTLPNDIANDPAFIELAIQKATDPIFNYKPWPTQARCYASKARYRYIGGANRKGKTAHLCIELVASALRVHPNKSTQKNVTFLVLAPSREQLQDPWAKKLLKDCELPGFEGIPFIPPNMVKKVYYTHGAGAPTVRQIDITNGNVIKLGISKDPESWKRKAGTALFAIILDEGEGDVNLLSELYPRLLDANKDAQITREAGGGWILWGATMTTGNQALVKFLENCDNPDEKDWEAFHFAEEEGSEADRIERERLRAAFSEDDYKVRMTGSARYEDRLLIYANHWNESVHMAPTDYIVQPSDNLWCAYDPGGAGAESHDTGILFGAISKDKPTLLRVVHCILLNRTILPYDFKRVAHWLRGRVLEGFIYDIAARRTDKMTGKSLVYQIKELMIANGIKSRRGVMACYNRHDPGIKRVQTYLNEGLIQLNPSKESGCLLLRSQILAYKSYEEGVYQGIRGVVKKNDELVDVLRYWITSLNAGRTRLCYVDRGCGEPAWNGAEPPKPAPPVPPPVLTPDQQNYQEQMMRSARMAAWTVKGRRMLN